MSVLTPNMSLYQPEIGVDSGLIWEEQMNANSSIVDNHNHSSGSGVQINPSGLNINADLEYNQNNAIDLRSSRYSAQLSPLAGPSDLSCVYVSGVDLYFNDGNGNQVRITSGGTVNATSSGISSGTATAAFSSSVLVVNQSSNTPATVQCGSVKFGDTGVSGSKFCTVSPPTALAANYALTLPVVSPSGTQLVTIDTSGNLAPNDGTVSATVANNIAQQMTSTGANAIATQVTRVTGTTVGVGGVAISSDIAFTTTSMSFVDVTNSSITITTSGRPVMIMIIADTVLKVAQLTTLGSSTLAGIQILRGSTVLSGDAFNTSGFFGDLSGYSYIDAVAAGTYTYKLQMESGDGLQDTLYGRLTAYEL